MKRNSAQLKQLARNALANRYSAAIGICVLYTLVTFSLNLFTTYVAGDFTVYSETSSGYTYSPGRLLIFLTADLVISILIQILACGLYKFFLDFIRKPEYRISDLFYCFTHNPDRFIAAILLQLAILIVPGIPVILLFIFVLNQTAILLLTFALMGCYIVYVTVMSLRYQLTLFLLIDHPDMGAREALRTSAQLMKGNKGRMFYISLSFIGWGILAVLTCGLGYLWLFPYMMVTVLFFYMDVTGELDTPPSEPNQDPYQDIYENTGYTL